MANEYKLAFTGKEIDAKLSQIANYDKELEMQGESKNINKTQYGEKSYSNPTFTVSQQADGSILLNGTTPSSATWFFSGISATTIWSNAACFDLPAGNYVLSRNGDEATDGIRIYLTGWYYDDKESVGTKTGAFILEREARVYVQIRFNANYTYNNLKLFIQLEKGTVATEWASPYEEGTGERTSKRLENLENAVKSVYNPCFKSVAHRGGITVVPECTAPAYVFAKNQGFRAAENDIRKTSDGVYIMWHDTTFSKLGNSSAVGNVDYATVSALDAGSYVSANFAGTKILTFKEWLILCKELGLEAWVDFKISADDTTASELISIARSAGMLRNIVWVGCDPAYLRKYDDKANVMPLVAPTTANVETYSKYIGDGDYPRLSFNGALNDMTENAIQLALSNGFGAYAWWDQAATVSNYEILSTIRPMIANGLQGVTLNNICVERLLMEQHNKEAN